MGRLHADKECAIYTLKPNIKHSLKVAAELNNFMAHLYLKIEHKPSQSTILANSGLFRPRLHLESCSKNNILPYNSNTEKLYPALKEIETFPA